MSQFLCPASLAVLKYLIYFYVVQAVPGSTKKAYDGDAGCLDSSTSASAWSRPPGKLFRVRHCWNNNTLLRRPSLEKFEGCMRYTYRYTDAARLRFYDTQWGPRWVPELRAACFLYYKVLSRLKKSCTSVHGGTGPQKLSHYGVADVLGKVIFIFVNSRHGNSNFY